MSWIVTLVAIVVVLGLYAWYATIVTRRNRVAEALAGIDVNSSSGTTSSPTSSRSRGGFLSTKRRC